MWKKGSGRKKRDEKMGIKFMTRARTSRQLLQETILHLKVSRDTFDRSTDYFAVSFSIDRSQSTEMRTKASSVDNENDGGVGYTYVCDLHRG